MLGKTMLGKMLWETTTNIFRASSQETKGVILRNKIIILCGTKSVLGVQFKEQRNNTTAT